MKTQPSTLPWLAAIAAVWLLSLTGVRRLAAGEGDWPTWRYDAGRTAASPLELPAQLDLWWKRELAAPRPAFPHCIDHWLPVHRRRGEPGTEEATIYALDLANGQVRWQTAVTTPAADKSDSPFGQYQPMAPWLAYCETSDLLVLTANWSILGALEGNSGAVLWTAGIPCADPPSRYSVPQPPILLPDVLITHGGQMYDPRTGRSLPNRLWRGINQGTRGCNRAVANPHVVVLRDADISYFDLAADGRQTRLRGIRSGCTNGLLPAGGILNAPNLAYHCSCNWPICTSIALVPMPQAGSWPPGPEAAVQHSW